MEKRGRVERGRRGGKARERKGGCYLVTRAAFWQLKIYDHTPALGYILRLLPGGEAGVLGSARVTLGCPTTQSCLYHSLSLFAGGSRGLMTD